MGTYREHVKGIPELAPRGIVGEMGGLLLGVDQFGKPTAGKTWIKSALTPLISFL
jgi:hypothetical protein